MRSERTLQATPTPRWQLARTLSVTLMLALSLGAGCAQLARDQTDESISPAEAAEPTGSEPLAQAASCRTQGTQSSPFGCSFAWGTDDSGAPLSGLKGVSFIAKWVGYEVTKSGAVERCDGCAWLRDQVAKTAMVPVYYAYFVGFFGHANGLMDGNQNPNGPNLTTDAAKLIRDKRRALVDMYAQYAKQSYAAFPSRPVVWLLEGDMVQYAGQSQKQRLSYTELSQFAHEVTCAIKSNAPNAVVAINHSTWSSDQVTHDFWGALKSAGVPYDLVWTTGVPNNNGFLEKTGNAGAYNAKTATYKYISQLTGRKILVDTSYGLSAMADSWSTSSPAVLNARIADGVIGANVVGGGKSPGYMQRIGALGPQLGKFCR